MAKRYSRFAVLSISALAAALLLANASVFAGSGLTVSGAKLVLTASPGDTFVHQITVSIGSDAQPVDITVQVSPMVQNPDGTPRPAQDGNQYSASGFITLDVNSFHLDPDGRQTVNATIRIPKDVGGGGRYALIAVATRPPPGSTLNVITGVNIPIYITIQGSRLTHQGAITSLAAEVSNNKTIEVISSLENTGNHDFKVKNNLTLRDSRGRTVASTATTLSLWTIIPGMSREIKAELFPEVNLSPGVYRVTSQMTLDDGTVLAEGGTNLELPTDLSAVAPPPATTAPSNNVLAVPGAGGTNWVLIIMVIVGVAILVLIAYYVFMNRWLKRPVAR